tara:strand:+ start:108 stop:341 length:234 start_codon:yes stop_codon:yes gene_type:complete
MNHKEVNEYRNSLQERMVRIEASIGIELPHISSSLEKIDKHLEKLNSRTATLESWKSWMAGGMAFLFLLITLAIGVL